MSTSKHSIGRSEFYAMLACGLGIPLVALILFIIIGAHDLMGDEGAHLTQIENLRQWALQGTPFVPVHPAIPGYHAMIAAASLLIGTSSVPIDRGLSLLFALIALPVVFSIMRKLGADRFTSCLTMLQFFLLPVAFPFLFLLYTDAMSVLVVLLCFHEALAKRHMTSGLLGIASIAVRQNNIFWVFFVALLVMNREWAGWNRKTILSWVRTCWPYLLTPLALGSFILWNGDIALADQGSHPGFTFHFGNIYFFFGLIVLLYFPLLLSVYPRVAKHVARYWKIVLPAGFVAFVFYMLTFFNTHSYNNDLWWIRNNILHFFFQSPDYKALYFVAVALGVFLLLCVPMRKRMFHVLYPVSALYLASSWLIDPRYHLIPLILFLLLRKPERRSTEIVLLVWFALTSAWLFWAAANGRFLP